jgi:hypothetical protein
MQQHAADLSVHYRELLEQRTVVESPPEALSNA